MKPCVAVVAALLLSACSGPGVREAIGTGAEATPIVLRTSESAVILENHAGRPLLNVRVAIDAAVAAPTQVTVKARDTLTNSYDVTTRWP